VTHGRHIGFFGIIANISQWPLQKKSKHMMDGTYEQLLTVKYEGKKLV
jgi:hypothetical protein